MDDLVSGTIEWPIASNGSCACRFVRRKDFGKVEQVERCGLHESQRAEMERLTAEVEHVTRYHETAVARVSELTSELATAKADRNTYDSAHKTEAANVLKLTAERDDLRKEVEALRVDALRYRWLRLQHWDEADVACVKRPKDAVKLGHDCPSLERLDAAIDAAMKAGE